MLGIPVRTTQMLAYALSGHLIARPAESQDELR
jgi:hypothetical protein